MKLIAYIIFIISLICFYKGIFIFSEYIIAKNGSVIAAISYCAFGTVVLILCMLMAENIYKNGESNI